MNLFQPLTHTLEMLKLIKHSWTTSIKGNFENLIIFLRIFVDTARRSGSQSLPNHLPRILKKCWSIWKLFSHILSLVTQSGATPGSYSAGLLKVVEMVGIWTRQSLFWNKTLQHLQNLEHSTIIFNSKLLYISSSITLNSLVNSS